MMIAPIKPDGIELQCAYNAIQLFEPDAILLRCWEPTEVGPSWNSFGAWEELKQFPIWDCENWTQAQKEIFTRTGKYSHLPPVPDLAKYLADNEQTLSEVELLDIEDAVIHIETVAKILHHFLLRDITEPIPEAVPEAKVTNNSKPSKATA